MKLRELNLDRMRNKNKAGLHGQITNMTFSRHITQQGATCLKVTAFVQIESDQSAHGKLFGNLTITATHFFRLDGPGAWFFGKIWKKIGEGLPLPATVEAAIEARKALVCMCDVEVAKDGKDGKYWKVQGW